MRYKMLKDISNLSGVLYETAKFIKSAADRNEDLTYSSIAARFKMSITSAYKRVRRLIDGGYISVDRGQSMGSGPYLSLTDQEKEPPIPGELSGKLTPYQRYLGHLEEMITILKDLDRLSEEKKQLESDFLERQNELKKIVKKIPKKKWVLKVS